MKKHLFNRIVKELNRVINLESKPIVETALLKRLDPPMIHNLTIDKLRRIVDEIHNCSEFDVYQYVLNPIIQDNLDNYSGLFACYDLLARSGKDNSAEGYFVYHKLTFRYLLLRNLREFKDSGSTNFYVEILGRPDTCSKCKHLEGEIYKAEDILKEMPIPNEDCTRESMCCSTFQVMTERRFLRKTEH